MYLTYFYQWLYGQKKEMKWTSSQGSISGSSSGQLYHWDTLCSDAPKTLIINSYIFSLKQKHFTVWGKKEEKKPQLQTLYNWASCEMRHLRHSNIEKKYSCSGYFNLTAVLKRQRWVGVKISTDRIHLLHEQRDGQVQELCFQTEEIKKHWKKSMVHHAVISGFWNTIYLCSDINDIVYNKTDFLFCFY